MSYWSENLNKYNAPNGIYRWHLDAFQKHLVSRIESVSPAAILDAGCGEGFLCDAIKQRLPEARITGVDFSQGAIDYAAQRFPDAAKYGTADIHALPCADRSFDIVVCSQVLEHLDNPDKAVREIIRVSSGYILISVPLEPYFKWFKDIGRLLRISPDPGHVQFWTKKSFPEFIGKFFTDAEYSTLHYYQSVLAPVPAVN